MSEKKYANLSNQKYWEARSEAHATRYWRKIGNIEKALAKEYRSATADIREQIADIYTQYATDNQLTYQEAIQTLNTVELRDYREKLATLTVRIRENGNPALVAEYEKLQRATQLTRLQAITNQMQARLLELGYTEQLTMEDWLADTYQDSYYHTIYDVQRGVGLGTSFTVLNEKAIKEAITYPWSGDMFSDLIWDNKQLLTKNLRQTITQGIIKGSSAQNMARDLTKTMDSSYGNALRLIRTETSYVISESSAKGYEQSGIVEQYRILATLDNRTSKKCQEEDNKVYLLSERQVGTNYPPFHPNCRTTASVAFDDLSGTRIARGEDGKTYKVPRGISYKEWYAEYVKGV